MASTELKRAQAWRSHQNGAGAEAVQLYRQLLEHHPEESDAINLGALLRSQGRIREAIQHYQYWLPRFFGSANLALNAVNCSIEANQLDLAQHWLEQGLQTQAGERPLLHAKARLLQAQGHGVEAESLLKTLCQQQPDDSSSWLDLGLAQHRLGKQRESLEAFNRAALLAPEDPRAAANQITLLGELGNYQEAKAIGEKLQAAVRNSGQVRGAIAHVLMEQQLVVEAVAEYSQMCLIEPEQPLHWLNRTACLRQLKLGVEALSVAKQGMALHPKHQDLHHALAQCYAEVGHHQQAIAWLSESLSDNADISSQHLFNLQFIGAGYGLIAAKKLAQMAKRWEQQQLAQGVGQLWMDRIHKPHDGRPLRVGYLSADFCNHPVGRFLLPIFTAHNPEVIEIVGLSCGPHQDKVQKQLQSYCNQWVNLRHASNLEAARMVSDLELDVIVELGGYTAGSRLDILCQRPAPVQLSYLGYFAPTYLNCIDGWIGDIELFGGLNKIDQNAHKLLQLQGGYMAYQDDSLPILRRSTMNRFRFGSFNHARKLSAAAVKLFCEVMQAVPQAELLLKSISFVEEAEQLRVRSLFEKGGLAENRLILLPWVEGRSAHLSCYQEIDVALDPLPYGGATTTCEALAMGVPVVTLAGEGMVGRLSTSVLYHSNCSGWIAKNEDQYIAIAQQLAAAGLRNSDKRQNLRQQLFESDLGNGIRLARQLEQLYWAEAAKVVNSFSK